MRSKTFRAALLTSSALVALSLAAGSLRAAETDWLHSAADDNWFNDANWSANHPTAAQDAVVGTDPSHEPLISGAATVNSLTVQDSTHMEIVGPGSLTAGSVTITDSGYMIVRDGGSMTVTGTLTVNSGLGIRGSTSTVSAGQLLLGGGLDFDGGTFTAATGGVNLTGNNSIVLNNGATFTTGNAGTVLNDSSSIQIQNGSTFNAGASGNQTITLNGSNTIEITDSTLNAASINATSASQINFLGSNAMTFAVPMSGALTVQFGINANLFLNAANTYSGTTTLGGGLVMAGVAGAFSPNSAFVLNSGVMALNNIDQTVGSISATGLTVGQISLGTATLTMGGDNSSTTWNATEINGTGGLTKTGTGTFTMRSQAFAYSGATTINGGKLIVNNASLDNSATTVNNGGTLGGNGTVQGVTVNSGGTLAPGNSIGTITVNGPLTFNAGSTYAVEVSPSAADKTVMTGGGALTLAGTVAATFQAGSYVTKSYAIITGAGSRTGTFGALTTANLPSGFLASLRYSGNDVSLDLALSNANLPPNSQGAGNAIGSYFNNGGALPPGFVTLTGLTGQAQQNGYAQVSGEGGNGAAQTAAYSATNMFMGAILGPSSDSRSGDDSVGATGYADEGNIPAAARDAYAAVTPRGKRAVARDSFAARWSIWATGYGGAASVNGNAAAGTHNTTSSVYGTAVGADYRIGRDTLLGFAMGGAGVNFHTDQGLGGGRADLFHAGLYGRHNVGAAYVSGALVYGWQDVTIDRNVTVAGTDHLRANFNAYSFSGRLETGYRIATAAMGVTPYAALQTTTFHRPGYAEFAVTGSNQFALAFAAQTSTNVRSELGVHTDKSFALADGILTARGRLAWAHDSNTDSTLTPTFQALPGSSSFTVNGAKPAADGALVTAGAEMKWRNGWSVASAFEGEFSRTTASYAGKGIVTYAW